MAGDHRNAQTARALRDQKIADYGLRRRQQASRCGVRRVLKSVVAAIDPDQQLDPVVVGSQIRISQRPVETQTITAAALEIVGAVAQGDTAPVVGAAAEHARTPPVKTPRIVLTCLDVRFTGDLPAAIDCCIVKAETFVRRGGGAERRLVRSLKHWSFSFGAVAAAGLKHQNLCAFHTQGVGALPARSPGTYDDDVVGLVNS